MLKAIVIFSTMVVAVLHAKDRSASIVVDGQTGRILHAENETALRYPASLTKKMTIYLAFDALRKGRITMNTQFRVSKRAAMQLPSKIYLKPGEMITVRKLLESLIVKSANDSAVVMAEGLAGSVENFANLMTKKAHALGMNHTVFKNPSGLNDQLKNDPRQYTTATDMTVLAMALHRDFPQHTHLFGLTQFSYKGHVFHTHNRMIDHSNGIDGMKTGFALAPGYNITTSAVRYDNQDRARRIFVVVMGGKTARSRDKRAYELIDSGFEKLGFAPKFQHVARIIDPLDALINSSQKVVHMPQVLNKKPNFVACSKKRIRNAQKSKEVRKNMVRSLSRYKKNPIVKHAIQYKKA